jgi:hypothetical protein
MVAWGVGLARAACRLYLVSDVTMNCVDARWAGAGRSSASNEQARTRWQRCTERGASHRIASHYVIPLSVYALA